MIAELFGWCYDVLCIISCHFMSFHVIGCFLMLFFDVISCIYLLFFGTLFLSKERPWGVF